MAAIHDGDPYTSGLTGAFTAPFEELGGSVTTVAINKGDTDMLRFLTQIAAGAPDGIFFPLFPDEGAHIVRQIDQIAGLEGVTLIGGSALLVSYFLSLPGSEGVYFPGPESNFTGKSGEELFGDYREKYRESPTSAYLASRL